MILDAYGRILAMNDAAAARFGFAEGKVIGKRFLNRLGVASRGLFAVRFTELRKGEPFSPFACDVWTLAFSAARVLVTHRTSAFLAGGEAYAFDLAWLE